MFAFLPQICAAYLLVVSLQKELKKNKNKNKAKTKRNETKRNETKQTKQTKKKQNKAKQNKTKQNKTKQNKNKNKNKTETKTGKRVKKNFCTHKSSYIFKHFESLPSIPLNGLYRNNRSCPLKNSRPNSRKLFPSTGKNPIINSIKVYHTNLTFSR